MKSCLRRDSEGAQSCAGQKRRGVKYGRRKKAAQDKLQGVVRLEDGVMLSQSYGRKNNSALLVYDMAAENLPDTSLDICGHMVPAYVLDGLRLRETLTVMPMSEGLCLSPKGVLVLFESGSSRYKNGKHRTDYVWALEETVGCLL